MCIWLFGLTTIYIFGQKFLQFFVAILENIIDLKFHSEKNDLYSYSWLLVFLFTHLWRFPLHGQKVDRLIVMRTKGSNIIFIANQFFMTIFDWRSAIVLDTSKALCAWGFLCIKMETISWHCTADKIMVIGYCFALHPLFSADGAILKKKMLSVKSGKKHHPK